MRAGARSAPPACLVARPSSAASAAADAVPLRLQINSVGPSRPIGPVAARRPVRAAGTTRPEKQAIGSCLGRQCGTAPDTARHEESTGPHSAGPLSAGPFRARAGLGPGGPFGILYPQVSSGDARDEREMLSGSTSFLFSTARRPGNKSPHMDFVLNITTWRATTDD
jgi:hypothetical protein